MFEVAATTAHRDAIRRAHSERAAVFAAGISWLRETLLHRRTPVAPAASASHAA